MPYDPGQVRRTFRSGWLRWHTLIGRDVRKQATHQFRKTLPRMIVSAQYEMTK